MDCACLVHKIWDYYKKGVYVQLIRSTRRYFWWRQLGLASKCIHPKSKPTETL